ncbi:hypothetical protein Hanom_Chr16g01429381 [Helianthus anomalus]
MGSLMLCFGCCFNVLVVFDYFVFWEGLCYLKLDCIDLFICWTWAECGFRYRICCFF